MQICKTIFDFLPFDKMTSEQSIALNALQEFVSKNNNDDFFILSGAAGTGKTSIMSALINYLQHLINEYRLCAPTGRAARILGRKAGCVSDTIHTLIYYVESNDNGQVEWILKDNINNKQCIYIVDEASMIAASSTTSNNSLYIANSPLLFDFKEFVKKGNISSKIIFIGDSKQLPPIEEKESRALDKIFLEKSFCWKGVAYTLSEVVRHKAGSYILENAIRIRKSIDDNTSMPKILANRYKSNYDASKVYATNFNPKNFEDAICIARTHVQNNIMNTYIRNNIFGGYIKPIVKGDLMMVNRNWSRCGVTLHNGDHVLVEDVDWDNMETVAGLRFLPVKLSIKSDNKASITIDDLILLDVLLIKNHQLQLSQIKMLMYERMKCNRIFRESKKPDDDKYMGAIHLIYGYSITCHKAQGGEWSRVYLNTFGVRDLKWMYTAVTRASKMLEIF
jgi:exodeoxyribonuclease V